MRVCFKRLSQSGKTRFYENATHVIPDLLAALHDEDENVRRLAVEQLGNIKISSVVPAD